MKQLLYIAIVFFVCSTFAQNNSQQDIWFNFQTPASQDINDIGIPDTPLILKNIHGTPTNYTIAAYFKAVNNPKVSDVIIDIKQISTKYDRRGPLMIYLSGKINLSCCFNGEISLDFFDADNNLVQKATTDAEGNFKLKSINGKMFTIKDKKIKFNFSTIKTYDLNADVRYAKLSRIKKALDNDTNNQETSITKKVVKSDIKQL